MNQSFLTSESTHPSVRFVSSLPIVLTVYLLFSSILWISCSSRLDKKEIEEVFGDIEGSPVSEERGAIESLSFLFNFNGDESSPSSLKSLKEEKGRMVFLTLLNSFPPHTEYGKGDDLLSSIHESISRFHEEVAKSPYMIDIVNGVTAYHPSLPSKMEWEKAGLEGILYIGDGGKNISFVLPYEVVSRSLYDHKKKKLRRGRIMSLLRARKAPLHPIAMKNSENYWTFTTESILFVQEDDPIPVVRGRVLPEVIDARTCLESAVRGGNYLKRAMDQDGRFIYKYDPIRDRVYSSYNMLRHAGTLYALLQLYETTHDDEYLQIVDRGISFALDSTYPAPPHTRDIDFIFVKSEKKAKLGGSALLLLALCKWTEITGDRSKLPVMEKLARFILFMQEASGKFRSFFQFDPAEPIKGKDSIYYPGEAILALVNLYKLTGEKAILKSAVMGADYLIKKRDRGKFWFNLPHDHWLMIGLDELHRITHRVDYLKQSMRLGYSIMKKQKRGVGWTRDLDGSFYTPPGSTPCATRIEGLVALINLLKRNHIPYDRYMEVAKRGLRFLISMQFSNGSELLIMNGKRVEGGFREDIFDPSIRIDYVQHAVSALIGMARILNSEEKERTNSIR